jgi:hypothetical protein
MYCNNVCCVVYLFATPQASSIQVTTYPFENVVQKNKRCTYSTHPQLAFQPYVCIHVNFIVNCVIFHKI